MQQQTGPNYNLIPEGAINFVYAFSPSNLKHLILISNVHSSNQINAFPALCSQEYNIKLLFSLCSLQMADAGGMPQLTQVSNIFLN